MHPLRPSNVVTRALRTATRPDHVIALACGGADKPSNMQWQTIEEGKAKDKWERIGCK